MKDFLAQLLKKGLLTKYYLIVIAEDVFELGVTSSSSFIKFPLV